MKSPENEHADEMNELEGQLRSLAPRSPNFKLSEALDRADRSHVHLECVLEPRSNDRPDAKDLQELRSYSSVQSIGIVSTALAIGVAAGIAGTLFVLNVHPDPTRFTDTSETDRHTAVASAIATERQTEILRSSQLPVKKAGETSPFRILNPNLGIDGSRQAIESNLLAILDLPHESKVDRLPRVFNAPVPPKSVIPKEERRNATLQSIQSLEGIGNRGFVMTKS